VLFNVIHGASAFADQEHSRSEVTVRLPLPPAAGTAGVLLVTVTPHRSSVGATTLVFADPPQAPIASSRMRPVVAG
jgi:hypothetical protein